MGKIRNLAVLVIMALMLACASTGSSSEMGLDAAIREASMEINDALPAGTKVALLNFTSPTDAFTDYVLEEMSISLVRGRKLVVVDRKEIDLIRGEMNFQMSGEVSDQSAQEIGAMLGAQSIISGSLVSIGDNHRFRTKVIDVSTAAIQTSASINFRDSAQVQHLLGHSAARPAAQTAQNQQRGITIVNNTGDNMVGMVIYVTGNTSDTANTHMFDLEGSMIGRGSRTFAMPSVNMSRSYTITLVNTDGILYVKRNQTLRPTVTFTFGQSDRSTQSISGDVLAAYIRNATGTAPAQASAPSAPAARTYRVGDTGPAGGLIFFDKGNNSGGWRYLEAAPVEKEFQASWKVRSGSVLDMIRETQSSIGSGKQNTQLIVEKLKQSGGEWNSAAIKTIELEINGFSDWFLPSSGELDLMYGNLKRRDIGDFSDGVYWSSTEYIQGPDLGWGVIAQNFTNSQTVVAKIGFMTDERTWNAYVRPIRQVRGN